MQWKKWTHITNHLFDIYAFIISYHYILISKFSIKSVKRVYSLSLFCFLEIFFEVFYFVQFFPWKIYICTSEVAISCSLFVNRSSQVKHTNDSSRTKIKVFTDNLNKFSIRNFTCSKCIYIDGSRSCNSDCVRKLDFAFISQSCCYNIFCNITSCLCGRKVNPCAVLTGESTANVTSCSTISIKNDFTSCQYTVKVRYTD